MAKGHIQPITKDGQVVAFRGAIDHPYHKTRSGNPKRLTKRFTIERTRTAKQAERAAQDWIDQQRAIFAAGGRGVTATKSTVIDACDDWLDAVAQEGERRRGAIRGSTLASYEKHIDLYLRNPPPGVLDIGILKLVELTAPDVEDWALSVSKHVSRDAAIRVLRDLRAALSRATRRDLILDNPASEVKLGRLKEDDGKVEIVLDANQVRELIRLSNSLAEKGWHGNQAPATPRERAAASNRRNRWRKWASYLDVGFRCGARTGEMLGAQWRDIDWNARTIRIERTLSDDGSIQAPKTLRGNRVIALDDVAIAALKQRKAWLAEQGRKAEPMHFIWGTNCGTKPTARPNLRDIWNDLCELAEELALTDETLFHPDGGTIASPYDIRHYHASMLIKAGVPLMEVSERLGHADTSITERHYIHLLGDRLEVSRRVADRFAEAFETI